MHFPRLISWAFLLLGLPCAAEESTMTSAKLWNEFLRVYAEESMSPLKPEDLDQRAQEALLSSLHKKNADQVIENQASLPALIQKIAEADQVNPFDLTEQAIQQVIPLIDPFGAYETTEELIEEQEIKPNEKQKGVFAMRLLIDKSGQLQCYPDPDGPTAKAGVPSGAAISKVNDVVTNGKSLAELRALFSQDPETDMSYTSADGKEKSVTIHSTQETFPDVQVYENEKPVRLRIRHFSEGSAAIIKSQMAQHSELDALVLDLRGNDGGLLQEALITCSLFLPPGAVISHDIVDGKKIRKRDDNEISIQAKSITIIIDGATASGSELLTTCLKYHLKEQVKITGSTSYGKHYRTVRTQLLEAGMLTITDGIILGPDGNTWPETGITTDP